MYALFRHLLPTEMTDISRKFPYLLIHVQFCIVRQTAQSLTDCYLVSVHRHHVEAEAKLINGQIVVPGMILKQTWIQRHLLPLYNTGLYNN